MKVVLLAIMFLVQKIRRDHCHYLSVPDIILSNSTSNQIMRLGHVLPSLVLAVILAVKVFPLLSDNYAEQLEVNGTTVPVALVSILFFVLILNGWLIEVILSRTSSVYRKFKDRPISSI